MADKFFKTLLTAMVSLVLIISCDSKTPVIFSIDPKIGKMGEIITLRGKNFGTSRDEANVTIAGIVPTSSSYYLWQDELIVVKVPELGESGLVYVHTKGKKSNGVLFSNSASVPKPIEGEELGLSPRIVSVTPQSGAPGTLIVINGSNFGGSRDGGGVFFSWEYAAPSFNQYIGSNSEYIEASDIELGYESWGPREIRVRLPDGAVSGIIEVRTAHGASRPFFFYIDGKPGSKSFLDKRSYTVNYSVDIKVLESTRPNALYLWMPKPVTSSYQRNVSLVSRNSVPFIEDHRGVSLFKLDNMNSNSNHSVNLSFNVEVYAVETEINPQSVKQEKTPLSALYTQSTRLIPADEPLIVSTVNTITGREQNPYNKARLLYNWILENIKPAAVFSAGNIVSAIESKQADSYTIALLYTAMARAAGIPCVPAAGVLVDQNMQTLRHYWAEFWLDGFGWVPVDPAMGMGAIPAPFRFKEDAANFYFGNMDNQRIAFSRGELNLSQIENRGRLVSHNQSYSLQNIWEEASGGLESYTSLWGDITITGIYSH